MADAYLNFDTKLNTGDFQKSLNGLSDTSKKAMGNVFGGVAAGVTAVSTGLMATKMVVRALSQVFDAVYTDMKKMDGVKEQVAGVELAFANLKNAGISAFMPLFNAILPVIMNVVTWLTEAANTAAAFIAALTGASTYMVYVADSVEGAGTSAGNWADEVERGEKAAKGALAGFDKLNVLQMEKTGSTSPGSGTGGGGGTGSWVEKTIGEDIQAKVKPLLDFLASVKLFFDTAKSEGWEAAFRQLFKVPEGEDNAFTWWGRAIDDAKKDFGDFKDEVDDKGFWDAVSDEFTRLYNSVTSYGFFKGFKETWISYVDIPISATIEGIKTGDWSTLGYWFKTKVLFPISERFGLTFYGPNGIEEMVDGVIEGINTGDWSRASTWFQSNVLTPILSKFGLTWEGPNGIEGMVNGISKGIRTGNFSTLANWFGTNVWDSIKTKANKMWQSLFTDGDRMGSLLGTKIGDLIVRAVNRAIDVINGMLTDIQNLANGILDFIDIFNSGKQYITITPIGHITPPTIGEIPNWWGLASGAVIPPNAPFPVIYGDQRSGRNLETPEKLMRQIVREETAGMGMGGGTIRFDVDEAGLMRYLHPKFEAETQRIGNSLVKRATA